MRRKESNPSPRGFLGSPTWPLFHSFQWYISRELKQPRQRRQRGGQKSKRVRLAKQHFCTCITLFCTFLCRRCTTTTLNCGREHNTTGCKESHIYSLPFWQAVAPKPFLIGRIDNNPSVIWISPKHSTCPSGKLRTKNTSPIAKSTSPGLSDSTFFARWYKDPLFLFLNSNTRLSSDE